MNTTNEEEILKALRNGDEEAFLKIYETYWYHVFMIAYKRLGKKEIAQELTQDLFLKLWEKREALRPQKIGNYLSVSIKNSVIDHINAGLVANKYVDFYKSYAEQSSSATQQVVEFDDLTEAIEKGLLKLPVKTQEVFKLSRLDRWSSEKIARHLNLSEKTVGYHLTKSLKFMRTYLREYLLMFLAAFFL
ncbi:RNA polymerase sigma factor [Pseudochryseolinea flava]|uniref:RNA polymerase sigma factor n=1 Tax=Pseudochryseolinea flava TaxID=2059302 RepID=UPI0014023250|nr:sigma-70 family RNA polymerase sigma factor [Pseudochryseolinea flava]